ncbi:RHS repeat-associated core domain-containing protein [Pseudescherichia vulneris]|uniref:RHS repeat-associated core domain-containing protein n=1 Tax=Pseudescherichia vulneris TaxID=566 RepID=UPI0030175FB4
MANPTAATGTPVISVHDNRGLAVRTLNWNREQISDPLRLLITHSQTNDASRVMSHRDARLFATWKGDSTTPANLRTTPSLAGQVLRRQSTDSGEQVMLFNAAGRPVWSRDGRGTVKTVAYDELGRPAKGSEQLNGSEIRVSWRSEYGDAGPADEGSQGNNLRGAGVAQYDDGGLVQVNSVALSGAVLSQGQRFLASAEALPDWPEDEAGREALLEAETYITSVTANARGGVLNQTDAVGHIQAWRYNVSGAVCHQTATPAGGETQTLLEDIIWSAAGQVLKESAGNGVTTAYSYDPQNQWLATITAQRTDSTMLQALTYGYDFTGNVTLLSDGAVASGYHRNQATNGTRQFTYDALYQLLNATGRENAGNTGMQYSDLPGVEPDSSQYVNYTRSYHYDDSGNLATLKHSGAGSFTRTMTTETTSNRSVQQNDGGPQSPDAVGSWFDGSGNLLTLQARVPVTDDNGLDPLVWDGSNNLQSVTLVSRSSGDSDREMYQYSGSQRVRKLTRTLVNGETQLWNMDEVRYLPGLELRRSWQEKLDSSTTTSLTEELHVVTSKAGRSGIRVLHWKTGKPDGIDNNQVRWSLDDNIGSLSLELDSEGQLISREEYYPFGGTAVWAARSEVDASYKTVRYSGKERDSTGLYYYGYRYYAPWLCRWASADPAGEVDGLNLFRMVRNNPSTYRDALGMIIAIGDDKYRNAAHFKRSSLYQNLLGKYSQQSIDRLITYYDSVGEVFYSERNFLRKIEKDMSNYSDSQDTAPESFSASQSSAQSDDYNIIIQNDIDNVFRADARSPQEIIDAGGFGNPPSINNAGTLGRFENGEPVEPIVYTAESKIGMTTFAKNMPGEKYYYQINTRGLKVASYEKNFENLKAQKNLLAHLKKQPALMVKAVGEDWQTKSDIELRKAISDVNNGGSWRSLTTGVYEAHVIGEPENLLTPAEIFQGKTKPFIPLDRIVLIGKVSEGIWDPSKHVKLTYYKAA